MPVIIAGYVLADYGGVVMGVPGHDRRDARTARALGLPVRVAVRPVPGELGLGERGAGGTAAQCQLHDWLVSRKRYWGSPDEDTGRVGSDALRALWSILGGAYSVHQAARADPVIAAVLAGRSPRRVVYVPGRVLNLVV